MHWTIAAAMSLLVLACPAASAQERRTVVYGGLGMAADEPGEVDAMPWSAGVMMQAPDSRFLFGFDLAGEGTMLDSTWGGDELSQALSLNLLLGTSIAATGTMRIEAGLLLGLRETFADCPDSYLGFQCYADRAPEVEYGANYGALVGLSFDRVMVGLRATGESTQAVLGFRF